MTHNDHAPKNDTPRAADRPKEFAVASDLSDTTEYGVEAALAGGSVRKRQRLSVAESAQFASAFRAALTESGHSMYGLFVESDVPRATIHRWLSHRPCRIPLDGAQSLVEVLALHIGANEDRIGALRQLLDQHVAHDNARPGITKAKPQNSGCDHHDLRLACSLLRRGIEIVDRICATTPYAE